MITPRPLHRPQDLYGPLEGKRDGFLNEEVHTALGAEDLLVGVRVGRYADEDRVQLLPLEHLPVVGVRSPTVPFSKALRPAQHGIRESNELDVLHLNEPIGVHLRNPAAADEAYPNSHKKEYAIE